MDPAQTQSQPQLAAMEEAADNFPDFVLSEKLPCPECHERCKTPQALANHIKIHTRGNAKPINERRKKKRKTPEAQPAANCVITNGELTSISIDPPQGCGWAWEVTTPPSLGFMPTIECAHSLKLLVGDKLLTFTPKSGSSSSQLLCRFTWNPLMCAQGADREALKREPHADDSSTRVPVHKVTSADESSGSNELDSASSDINEEWESDTSETSDESDASDISGSGKSDAGDRDIGNGVTPNESDAGNASNASNAQEANSQSCAVTGSPMTTPLPTCPAAHSDHHHLDFLCLPLVQDLKENDADATQQTGQVQEDLVNRLMEGGAEEREELSDDDDEEEDNAVVLCRTFDTPSNASQDSDDSNKKSTQVATSTGLPLRSSSFPGAHFSPQGAPTCPTCERTFRTRQGLAGHRVAGHCRKKDDKMMKDKKTGIPSVSGSDVPPFAPTLPWD